MVVLSISGFWNPAHAFLLPQDHKDFRIQSIAKINGGYELVAHAGKKILDLKSNLTPRRTTNPAIQAIQKGQKKGGGCYIEKPMTGPKNQKLKASPTQSQKQKKATVLAKNKKSLARPQRPRFRFQKT